MSIKKVVEAKIEDKATNEDLFVIVNRISNISSDLSNATSNIKELKIKLDKALNTADNNIKEEVQDLVNTIDNFKKNTISSTKESYKYLINICFFIVLISILWLFYKILGVKAVDYIYIFLMGFLGSGAGIILNLYSIKKL
jgi:F0F1-type ATP synthase assembly protein I